MGAIRLVSVGVTDTAVALRLYRDVLGLVVDREGEVSRAQLDAWGVDRDHAMRFTELSCDGYPVGRLRLLERVPRAEVHVRRDLPGEPDGPCDIGPKAMDFYPPGSVLEAVRQLESAGYPARSRPVSHQEGGLDSHELLFTGPDGVGVLVMEGVHGDLLRDRGAAQTYSEVSTVAFIAADVEASHRFYGGLGLVCAVDVEPDAEATAQLAEIADIPAGLPLHLLLYREAGEPSGKVLLVHVPSGHGRRLTGRMQPGHIGIALVTMAVPDVREAARRAVEGGGAIERSPAIVDGAWSVLVRGPNEELIELREAAA